MSCNLLSKFYDEPDEDLTTEEGLEMGTLYSGGTIFAIRQPTHGNDGFPIDPEFKFAWISGKERVTGMKGSLVLPFSSPGLFNLTLSATVTHLPRWNTKAPRPTENPNWGFP